MHQVTIDLDKAEQALAYGEFKTHDFDDVEWLIPQSYSYHHKRYMNGNHDIKKLSLYVLIALNQLAEKMV